MDDDNRYVGNASSWPMFCGTASTSACQFGQWIAQRPVVQRQPPSSGAPHQTVTNHVFNGGSFGCSQLLASCSSEIFNHDAHSDLLKLVFMVNVSRIETTD